jgi:PAS domain S-box-containing protein
MSDSRPSPGLPGSAGTISSAQVQALRRVALAVAHPGGPKLFEDLVLELAASLEVAIVFVAVFADADRATMQTLAVCLDGRALRNFDYGLRDTPCEAVVGRSCLYISGGASSQLLPDTVFTRQQMDSFAAFPLNDSAGAPLGLLAAMNRSPIADGDAAHAEAMLKIIAGRIAAEIAQKNAVNDLRRSEARLRATVEASFDCVIGMDSEGVIVEFNAAAERVFGRRRQDVLGRSLAETILPQRHRDAHTRGIKHFLDSGRGPMIGRLVETTALRADGTEFAVELAISVAAVPEGSIFVGHLRDITARKAAEAQRAALESQLRQAQKMEAIGQLTGGLAHDFNNILTSVIGYVAMAQEQPAAEADPALTRQLGQARLAAERARDHVAQLLAFSRPQRGERRLVEPARVAGAALQLLQPTLPSTIGVEWMDRPHAGNDIPPIVADAVQLEQVLFNLFINARDAIRDRGTIRVRVGHSATAAGHCASCSAPIAATPWVWVEVADDGRGIPPEAIGRMFEPFFTTKEGAGGTGLGLAMVHGIVHDHGGHIEVSSQSGGGSVFRVLLPAAARQPQDIAAFSKTGTRLRPLLRGHVLLVEDEAMVSDYVSELLTGFGFEVARERDPLLAAKRLADSGERFDILLTDYTMPGMTGTALACHSASHRPALPVVLYTGNASEITQDELDRCGVRALIRKPFDAVSLRSLLAGLLQAKP